MVMLWLSYGNVTVMLRLSSCALGVNCPKMVDSICFETIETNETIWIGLDGL